MTNATQAKPLPRNPTLPLWSRLSLRAKLVVILLMAALIPLTIAALINGDNARKVALREADQKLLGAAQSLADQIESALQAALDSVRYQAHLPATVNYLLAPAAQRAHSPEEENLLDFMLTAARENPLYVTSMAVFDAQGVNLLDTSAAEIGLSIAQRAYFQQAIESGLPVASSVERDPVAGKPSIYFIAPIQNANDEIIGALRVRYDALMLQELVAQNNGRAGESSFAMLLDEQGIILAHGADTHSLSQPAGLPRSLATPTFSAALQGGETLRVALVPIEGAHWTVAFAQPQALLLAPANAQMRANVAVAFVLAVGVTFFGLIVAEALAASIIRLTESQAALLQAKVEASRAEETPAQAIPVFFEPPPAALEEEADLSNAQTQTVVAAPPVVAAEQKQARVSAQTSPRKPRHVKASEDHLEVAIERLGMILRASKVSAEGETSRRENRP